ncbi:thioredoxin family protein [Caminibacter sp.]
MKKIFLLLIGISFLFSMQTIGKIHWYQDFKKAREIAKKEHKIIMVDISLHHCPPCWYMANIVYEYQPVADYVNKNFVPVFYYADKDRVPLDVSQYFLGTAPTVLFISPDDKLIYRVIGSRPAEEFLKILKKIKEK